MKDEDKSKQALIDELAELRRRISELEESQSVQPRTEEALRQSEERFRGIFEHTNSGVAVYEAVDDGADFVFVDFNTRGEEIEGISREELLGKRLTELFPGVEEFGLLDVIRRVWQTGEPAHHPVQMYHDDRIQGWRENYVYRLGAGEIVAIYEDESERMLAQEELRHSEELYRTLAEGADDEIFLLRPDGEVTYVNRAGAKLFRRDRADIVGHPIRELFPPPVADQLEDSLRTVVAESVAVTAERPIPFGEQERWLSTKLVPVEYEAGRVAAVLGISRDITERKSAELERRELEGHLQQAQKLEALGTLAGGIAHDFNNLLQGILGYVELARRGESDGERQRYYLDQVAAVVGRAVDLVSQILTFSHETKDERQAVRLRNVVEEALGLLQHALPTTIEIRPRLDDDAGFVMANPTQLHQVIMNLATNAAHAMWAKGGVLTLRLGVATDDEALLESAGLIPGGYASLTVSDTGEGMSPETLAQIFDPYFTTKAVGKGTGLGLATVHGIVKRHRGAVVVESEQGKGSTFTVLLPFADGQHHAAEIHRPQELPPEGTERILFVDDEPGITETTKLGLQQLGYTVETSNSSIEALAMFSESPERFDIVITDQTMPSLTGTELALKVIELCPSCPVILCTGYSDVINETRARELGISDFLMKPIAAQNLARSIRNVLTDSAPQSGGPPT